MSSKRNLIQELIQLKQPVSFILDELYDNPQFLTNHNYYTALRQDYIRALSMFCASSLSSEDLYRWNNFMLFGEYYTLEAGFKGLLSSINYEIDDCFDVGYSFTPEVAREMIHRIQAAVFDPEDI